MEPQSEGPLISQSSPEFDSSTESIETPGKDSMEGEQKP